MNTPSPGGAITIAGKRVSRLGLGTMRRGGRLPVPVRGVAT